MKFRFAPFTTTAPAGASPAAVLSENDEPLTEAASIGSVKVSCSGWFCAISVMLHPTGVQPRLQDIRQNLEVVDAQFTFAVEVPEPPLPQPPSSARRPVRAKIRKALACMDSSEIIKV